MQYSCYKATVLCVFQQLALQHITVIMTRAIADNSYNR